MKNSAQKALRDPQESFAALAVALPSHWHQAVIRLAKATERVERRWMRWALQDPDDLPAQDAPDGR